MDYRELKLYDFDEFKNNLDYYPEKETLISGIWQEDELQFVNWIVGLLI